MENELLDCLRELAESAEPMVHLITDPTPEQKRLQDAIKKANALLPLLRAKAA